MVLTKNVLERGLVLMVCKSCQVNKEYDTAQVIKTQVSENNNSSK